ncbi:MAG: electron transport complex subunit RsxC [Bacteroidetes bacterium]|jgi:Na+-translocating ferredoxin:NAD+ oxidoreductase subunit C|nr:electron transport complex subunit RsxC [Bacteroidota bacterium]MBT6687693.1 electron transport complex subunit RsxC [Bacteroidota bacterium]MBT7143616.1 electron transport complex subunit RsxC [Bacteroidota bacterium]MBT7490517.1 electron transport complex subunit RsxC [Bacteroidota bacterium]
MLKTFPKGGVHPPENKISKEGAIVQLAIPKTAYIPISQHLGAPSTPVVKKGDAVKVGQIIAKSSGFVSTNIHSSVSGTVQKIDDIIDSSGYKRKTVIIKVEGDEWLETIDQSKQLSKNISVNGEEIISKILESGIVGLGGATFPTHIKLSVPKGKTAEVLIINGVECEPYLTSDHRLMLEKAEEMLIGTQILMRGLNVKKAMIGIENNKPDAIELLSKLVDKYPGIEIYALKVQYPQGGEKQLIKALINREVPSGGLPIDVGAVVQNVGTTFAVYEAIQKNKPLFERVVTVTGKSVSKPANYMVRIGTPVSELLAASGGIPDDTGKIISGGPMMGKALNSVDSPVTKGTSGILILPEDESKRKESLNCIRCARCTVVCPMGLEPFFIMSTTENKMFDKVESANVMDCIECGSCSYTCPSNRPLLDYIRLGKGTVGQIIRARRK